MSLQRKVRIARRDEAGFAIVLAVALMALISIVAVALPLLVQGEDSKSRRDQAQDGAYQAAEAGTNAVLSDLTQDNQFFDRLMAKGEATRYNPNTGTTFTNNCVTGSSSTTQSTCSDKDVSGSTWTTWTYPTAKTSDTTGWYSLGNGYQYLINITSPKSQGLSGLAEEITTIDVTGRPYGSTNVSQWRTIETMIRPSSLTDFQAFTAENLAYGSTATTLGPIFVGQDAAGNTGSLIHQGTADANMYAQGTVSCQGCTKGFGVRTYDSTTNPTALCELNNCAPILFSSFAGTFANVSNVAQTEGSPSPFVLGTTDPNNSDLVQNNGGNVDAWKLDFGYPTANQVTIWSCRKYNSSTPVWDSTYQPTCGDQVAEPLLSKTEIYSATDVIVYGVVKGLDTVASAGNVIYGGNTTYNTPGVDVLGVEATGNIIVAQWAVDSHHNITIYSAQFALNGAFESDPNYGGYASGTLTFYGSTAVYGIPYGTSTSCPNTSTTDCTILFSGFFSTRSYNYDENLLFVQPPDFPSLGNNFKILVQRQL